MVWDWSLVVVADDGKSGSVRRFAQAKTHSLHYAGSDLILAAVVHCYLDYYCNFVVDCFCVAVVVDNDDSAAVVGHHGSPTA